MLFDHNRWSYSIGQKFFQVPVQRFTNKTFLFFGVLDDTDIKYDNSFSNTSQKKSNKTILVPNLVFFINIELWIYLNLRVLISNKTIALSNCNLKVSKCDIFDPKIKYFSFTKNFAFLKNSRAPISNTTKVYSQSNSKIYKKINFAFFFFF